MIIREPAYSCRAFTQGTARWKTLYPADTIPLVESQIVLCFLSQHWFSLSDPTAEEALYDQRAMRAFVRIDLGREGGR